MSLYKLGLAASLPREAAAVGLLPGFHSIGEAKIELDKALRAITELAATYPNDARVQRLRDSFAQFYAARAGAWARFVDTNPIFFAAIEYQNQAAALNAALGGKAVLAPPTPPGPHGPAEAVIDVVTKTAVVLGGIYVAANVLPKLVPK